MSFPQGGIEKLGQDPLLQETGFLSRVLKEDLQEEGGISRSVLEAALRIVSRSVQEPPSGSMEPVSMDVTRDAQRNHKYLLSPSVHKYISNLTLQLKILV